MNKKITAAVFAAAAAFSVYGAAMAADVTVKVNGAVVDFEDQGAIIENDRTLVPARGAFEAMDAKVEWDEDDQTVTVTSPEGTTVAILTIGSSDMRVLKYTSVLHADEENIKLDVPASIMNDRTMLPLRAIGEAMDAEVEWDADTYTASIERGNVFDVKEENKLTLSLEQEESENSDEVIVDLKLANLGAYPGYYVGGVTLGLNYDRTVLELEEAALYNGDTKVDNSMGVDNSDFKDSRLKSAHITIDEENAAKTDGTVFKMKFKRLTSDETEVSVSTSYHSRLGYDTSILLCDSENNMKELWGTDLIIGEPLIIK